MISSSEKEGAEESNNIDNIQPLGFSVSVIFHPSLKKFMQITLDFGQKLWIAASGKEAVGQLGRSAFRWPAFRRLMAILLIITHFLRNQPDWYELPVWIDN